MTTSQIRLDYGSLGSKDVLQNISTVAQAGKYLWLASDEGRTIERLEWDGRRFAKAVSYNLADYFPLPKGGTEIDVEALSIDQDRLWVAGSHSITRQKPASETENLRHPQKFLANLATVKWRPRRYLIGRLDLAAKGGKIISPASGSAPCVNFSRFGNDLTKALGTDPHLSAFLALPDKENGLDIEGLVARDDRLFLGLRGPVIQNHAVILEISARIEKSRVKLAGIGGGGHRYRKYFLDLGGLGIRDLTAVGDDLLVLAGPTMGLPGPWAVKRWRNALRSRREGLVGKDDLRPEPGLTFEGPERPEGITRFQHPDGRQGWLVVYDQPSKARLSKKNSYRADFFH